MFVLLKSFFTPAAPENFRAEDVRVTRTEITRLFFEEPGHCHHPDRHAN